MRLPSLSAVFSHKILPVCASFIILTSLFLVLAPATSAQNYSPYIAPNTDSNVPQNQHTFVQSMMIEVLASVICQLSGTDIMTNKTCLTVNPLTNKIGYAPENSEQGGVIGVLTSSMGSLYDIPIHSSSYVSYMAGNFGLTTPAYAQNTGFQQLDYMLRFWKIFRDIAYIGFVIAFVIIGLAIMLRVKIDPRTVMSIQNQLPKIIITMVLITFSYSIVGFLVDTMWATTYLTINLFESVEDADQIDNGKVIQDLIKSPFGFFGSLTANVADGYDKNTPGDIAAGPMAISRRVGETFGQFTKALSPFQNDSPCGFKIGPWQAGDDGGNIGNCAAGMFNAVIQWTITVLVTLVILTTIIITLFRIWFMLIRSFAYIIIYTALGPLYLFAGIFPGSSFGFDPWIRGIISNLIIFPVCIAVMLAGRILMTSSNGQTIGFNPPLIGTPANGVTGLGYLIGFAFLLILPDMLTMVREALKSPPNKFIAPAIVGGFKAGAGAAAAIPSKTWGKVFERDSHGNAKGKIGKFLTYGTGGAIHSTGTFTNKIANKIRGGLRYATGTREQGGHEERERQEDVARRARVLAQQRLENQQDVAAGRQPRHVL